MTALTVAREQTIADLRAAAAVQRQRGWTRHMMFDPATGCVCAAGAIRFAVCGDDYRTRGITEDESERVMVAEDAASRHVAYNANRSTLTSWNDRLCSGAEEAAVLLESVAAELAAVGGAS